MGSSGASQTVNSSSGIKTNKAFGIIAAVFFLIGGVFFLLAAITAE